MFYAPCKIKILLYAIVLKSTVTRKRGLSAHRAIFSMHMSKVKDQWLSKGGKGWALTKMLNTATYVMYLPKSDAFNSVHGWGWLLSAIFVLLEFVCKSQAVVSIMNQLTFCNAVAVYCLLDGKDFLIIEGEDNSCVFITLASFDI